MATELADLPVLSENSSPKTIGALQASLSAAHGIKRPEFVGIALFGAISAHRLCCRASAAVGAKHP